MHLTARILAAWPRWRTACDDAERARVACYCDLCAGEVAVLDRLRANVEEAGHPLAWLEAEGVLWGDLRAGIVETLLDGLDVAGHSPRRLARLFALEDNETHHYALLRALEERMEETAAATVPHIEEDAPVGRALTRREHLRQALTERGVDLMQVIPLSVKQELADALGTSVAAISTHISKLRQEPAEEVESSGWDVTDDPFAEAHEPAPIAPPTVDRITDGLLVLALSRVPEEIADGLRALVMDRLRELRGEAVL